jgi:AraC family transcriptional regulator, positive regulator of tynA and feaB
MSEARGFGWTAGHASGPSVGSGVTTDDFSARVASAWPSATSGPSTDYGDLSRLPAAEREEGWEALLSTTHLDMSVRVTATASGEPFRARVRRQWIGDLALVDAECDPCTGTRGRVRAARSDGRHVAVMVARRGRETVALGDTLTNLGPGDAVVWRSDLHARFRVHEPLAKRTLIVPVAALSEVRGGQGAARAGVLDRDASATQLLVGYLDVLARTVDRLSAPELAAARCAALELFVAAARRHPDASRWDDSASALRAVIAGWIEQRLATEVVSPAAIAAAHGLSVRGVYRVFEGSGETVGGYVRARRLARARRDLTTTRDPISEVAVRWGFSDASHFARAFRTRYGCSPGDCRAEAPTPR